MTQIWLTPESMTIHAAAPAIADDTLQRFTAVTEFDDGTVADVTMLHGLQWSTLGTSFNQTDVDGFITIAPADIPGGVILVVAKTSAAWGSKSTGTAGKVVVAVPWSTEPLMPATLVEGPPAAWATVPLQADLAPNVLFLGIGFPVEDNDAFETLIADACRRIKRDRITRPYDLLSDSINFWRLRAPAKTRGITVRSEVYVTGSPVRQAKPLTAAIKPPESGKWGVSHLMYAAGRPMPADVTRDVASLRSEFTQRVAAEWALSVLDEAIVTSATIRRWQAQGARMLVEAIDGFRSQASVGCVEPPAQDRARRGKCVSIGP